MCEPEGKAFHSVQKLRFFNKTGLLVDPFHELEQFVCHAGRLAQIIALQPAARCSCRATVTNTVREASRFQIIKLRY
jgi:hypothetical protein